MKRIYLSISCLMLSAIGLAQVSLDHVSTHFTNFYDESAAEIVTYDAGSQKIFFSNAFDNSVGILDFSDPTNLSLLSTINLNPYGDGVNSVSAFDGMLAVAVEVDGEPGMVVFFDHDGNFQSQVEVGYLPDMLAFSHDGNKVVVACEGEPASDYLMDPVGSVAIIDVSGGVASVTQGDVTITEIGSYTGSLNGVRIFGPEAIYAFEETFQDTAMELNQFVTFNELSAGPWHYDSFMDDYFAEANGFGDDTASIDWLISDLIDITNFTDASVFFYSAKNFSGGSMDFLVSDDYDGMGDPTTATWDTLTAMAAWSPGGYLDTNSGDISLSSYIGSEIAVAFLYKSTGNGGGNGALWQIDDIVVAGSHSDASNFEPEYVAISADNSTAFVSLQENNAVAVVNLSNGNITDILPLGWKDHSVDGNGLDASDKDDEVNITTYPFRGLYLPDAIATVNIAGTDYIITANEGDARDYDAYSEEERLKDVDLDPTAFPDAATLQADENGGRINITTSMGDTDGDGDFDEIYTYGARSFTIWDASGNVVFDSGDDFEQITATEYPADFNSGNDENDDFEGRSDNKGPEPEAVEIATIGDKVYAFIGLERIGGVMMYDITDPANATFVTYVNNRDFSVMDPETNAIGDLGCEDVLFIDSASSADGNYYIVTSNEVSGTVSVFQINGVVGTKDIDNATKWALYPNPANDVIKLSVKGNYRITDLSGRVMGVVSNTNTVDVCSYNAGVYFISNNEGETKSFIKN
ncbi:choice-of-anchor I family protein [Salibacteraceae bacterium]|nr:choice-of-anchor I family protein [Salibacteraceae bacterium]MDB4104900.1 choice-of-anchor I family protein [Salibacteraceae bacterium]MDC1304853.1 choice-of-anchor I family protein [Salibacteraceae bacterium]